MPTITAIGPRIARMRSVRCNQRATWARAAHHASVPQMTTAFTTCPDG